MILYLIIASVAVVLDQLSKYAVVTWLRPVETVTVIDKILNLTYVENTGAAFGMLSEHRWIFMTVSTAVIIGLTVAVIVMKPKNKLMLVSLGMVVGGGIGNMIDRIVNGYVVDMIDVQFVKFYVFNVADSFVCVGCGLLILSLIIDEVKERKAKKNG